MKIGGTNLLVMGCRVMFGEVVGLVEAAFLPIDVKLSLANVVTDPIKVHVNCLGLLFLMVSLAMPAVVLLSIWMGIGGCRWFNSMRVVWRGQASLPLWKRAASLASAALEMISHKIWQMTLMVPLADGVGLVGCGGHVGSEGRLLR